MFEVGLEEAPRGALQIHDLTFTPTGPRGGATSECVSGTDLKYSVTSVFAVDHGP